MIANIGEDMEQLKLLYIADNYVKYYNFMGKHFDSFFMKLNKYYMTEQLLFQAFIQEKWKYLPTKELDTSVSTA